jgi:hypothetical protein
MSHLSAITETLREEWPLTQMGRDSHSGLQRGDGLYRPSALGWGLWEATDD